MDANLTVELSKFKSPTADMMYKLREQASARVIKELGEVPDKEEYIRRAGAQPPDIITLNTGWMDDIKRKAEPQDYMAAILAICFWVWSITHILTFALVLANQGALDVPENYDGIQVWSWMGVVITQIVLILASEVGVLYFFYRHMLIHIREKKQGSPLRTMSANYIFAIIFAILTITANVWAMISGIEGGYFWMGVGGVVGIVLPFINMFLGERFTELIAEVQDERVERLSLLHKEQDSYYILRTKLINEFDRDTKKYWAAHSNPDKYHQDDNRNFTVYFAEIIIDYYKRYNKVGREYDWIPSVERALAAREIASSRMGGSLLDEINAMTQLFTQGD